METMNTPVIITLAVVVVLLILVIALILLGNKRRKDKAVSFESEKEPKELTQQEKSGNYQAAGGFNFAAATPGAADQKRAERVERSPAMEAMEEPATLESEVSPEPIVAEDHESSVADSDVSEGDAAAPAEEIEHVKDADEVTEAEREVEAVDAPDVREAEGAAGAAEVAAVGAGLAKEVTPVPDEPAPPVPEPLDDIAPAAGRMGRLRGRLSRSQNAIGQGLLGILTAGDLDEDAWEEIEDTLISADLGAELTMKVTESLRTKIAERGVSNEAEARAMLRETLIEAGRPELDRSIKAMPVDGKPAVILIVGVNGTGKTTTTGKLARVLVSMGHRVLLGAADTFRAAAADQLETWGRRVGATTVRGAEGADPASVAFDAVSTGVQEQADVVLVDTAGRLHTSQGLMDQLGKVKRVVEKKSNVDEVLLVLDATVGQNGLMQARVFRDVVDITGVVLTKLDGTAKGGIVFKVQEELGVPVKLVGLGEGADDLAPFEVEGFVDALLG